MKFNLWLVALAFFWEQNQYYGWHQFPTSDSELIADGITLILTSLALFASPK